MVAALSLADGISIVEETVFENRLMHVQELKKMGAFEAQKTMAHVPLCTVDELGQADAGHYDQRPQSTPGVIQQEASGGAKPENVAGSKDAQHPAHPVAAVRQFVEEPIGYGERGQPEDGRGGPPTDY
jgi:hypothetical protein